MGNLDAAFENSSPAWSLAGARNGKAVSKSPGPSDYSNTIIDAFGSANGAPILRAPHKLRHGAKTPARSPGPGAHVITIDIENRRVTDSRKHTSPAFSISSRDPWRRRAGGGTPAGTLVHMHVPSSAPPGINIPRSLDSRKINSPSVSFGPKFGSRPIARPSSAPVKPLSLGPG